MSGQATRNCLRRRVNLPSVCWYWVTMIGVFYIGLTHILPFLYADFSDAWMTLQHLICCFIFFQMALNWACIRLIPSVFNSDEHLSYITSHADEIANGGFEINLNHLKSVGDTGTFSLPMKSVQSVESKKRWDKETMYIMSLPEEEIGDGSSGDQSRKIVYPYWSWKPCLICQCQRPPRTHHCPLCNMCVLKRDHHCFFTGSCIGLRNQRHFVVFTFWSSVATSYCLLHATAYLLADFVWRNSAFDLIIPLTWIRWLFGYIPSLDTTMVTLLYSLVWFWITSITFFVEQIKIICHGLTSFERDNRMKIMNSSSTEDKLRGVFGEYWYLNFLVPLHNTFPNTDDGVEWKTIKI